MIVAIKIDYFVDLLVELQVDYLGGSKVELKVGCTIG
jgi:hypothetical protein